MLRDAINVLFQLGKKFVLWRKKSLKITKNVLRSRKSKKIKWSKEKGQKDKQWSTKQYKEKYRMSNTNPTKNCEWRNVLQKDKQFSRWFPFLHCELSVYISQQSSRNCMRNMYLSFDTITMSLWILSWLFLW
jgi:hypothetical protein